MEKAKKPLSGKKLTTLLDDAIRDYYHKKYPQPECFVCKKKIGWFHPKDNPKGCQIGHYVSRRFYGTRWDLLNIWCQCSTDNYLHQHNPIPFTMAILDAYGQERLDYLNNARKTQFTTLQKREMLQTLLTDIEQLA